LPGASDAAQIEVPDLRARSPEIILILVIIYPAGRAGKGSAGVPLLWPGTDVLLNPGNEHDGIVPPGTDRDAEAAKGQAHNLIPRIFKLNNIKLETSRLANSDNFRPAPVLPGLHAERRRRPARPDLEFRAICARKGWG
jgi:hypothetical protein